MAGEVARALTGFGQTIREAGATYYAPELRREELRFRTRGQEYKIRRQERLDEETRAANEQIRTIRQDQIDKIQAEKEPVFIGDITRISIPERTQTGQREDRTKDVTFAVKQEADFIKALGLKRQEGEFKGYYTKPDGTPFTRRDMNDPQTQQKLQGMVSLAFNPYEGNPAFDKLSDKEKSQRIRELIGERERLLGEYQRLGIFAPATVEKLRKDHIGSLEKDATRYERKVPTALQVRKERREIAKETREIIKAATDLPERTKEWVKVQIAQAKTFSDNGEYGEARAILDAVDKVLRPPRQPQEGDTATGAKGEKLTLKGGQWVPTEVEKAQAAVAKPVQQIRQRPEDVKAVGEEKVTTIQEAIRAGESQQRISEKTGLEKIKSGVKKFQTKRQRKKVAEEQVAVKAKEAARKLINRAIINTRKERNPFTLRDFDRIMKKFAIASGTKVYTELLNEVRDSGILVKSKKRRTIREPFSSIDSPAKTKSEGYGLRPDGTKKGPGFLGTLKRPDGKVSTELSIGVEFDGKETLIPSLVPTLTPSEIAILLAGEKPNRRMLRKAVEHAKKRIKAGKSPFKE